MYCISGTILALLNAPNSTTHLTLIYVEAEKKGKELHDAKNTLQKENSIDARENTKNSAHTESISSL